MSAETLQIAEMHPEIDFLELSALAGRGSAGRDKISRWMKSGIIVGVVPGLYVSAPELRKRPVSLEILANRIYGPSYVSFESVLARAGLIPEEVRNLVSATPKRNRDVDTPLGRFSYRHLPREAYSFGYVREDLPDETGYLIARPEKAILDLLYMTGSLRSVRSLEDRLFGDLRIDFEGWANLDFDLLAEYARRMPGATFRTHLCKLIGRRHE